MVKVLVGLVLLGALALLILRLVFRLPSLAGRREGRALGAGGWTAIARRIGADVAAHPGLSGLAPVFSGAEAFAARILLARAAERSIDAQYYIWHNDVTGILLLGALRDAAQRGVRVRLLVDDNGTPDLDRELAALNALPNAEVRIFNPFNLRTPRLASYAFDFFRLNRRMHNKAFTVDGLVTIIGGRNVGDDYFSRAARSQFSDLDLIAIGAVVPDVDDEFDAYWNSNSAYPHERLVAPPADGTAALDRRLDGVRSAEGNAEYGKAIARTQLISDLTAGTLAFEWAQTRLVADDPAKGLGDVPLRRLMGGRLLPILREARTSIDIVSPYLIPGVNGSRFLARSARRGIAVRTMTNALEATDVIPVHASYAKYRGWLVRAGVEVYELRARPATRETAERMGLIGSKAASLHAKTFILDGARVFVGSFNFDPRSLYLNCEMGFLVESPALARMMRDRFERDVGFACWHVTRRWGRGLVWNGIGPEGERLVLDKEPGATLWNRITLRVVGWLPVEWLM